MNQVCPCAIMFYDWSTLISGVVEALWIRYAHVHQYFVIRLPSSLLWLNHVRPCAIIFLWLISHLCCGWSFVYQVCPCPIIFCDPSTLISAVIEALWIRYALVQWFVIHLPSSLLRLNLVCPLAIIFCDPSTHISAEIKSGMPMCNNVLWFIYPHLCWD